MKIILSIASCICLFAQTVNGQQKTVTTDTDWTKQYAIVNNSMEAELIIRQGDIDNMGFGWPEDFDPFCGRMTQAHAFPWDIPTNDLPCYDRILISSKYNPNSEQPCSRDGYSDAYDAQKLKPFTTKFKLEGVTQITIKNAYMQLFIDDFQSPSLCSKFQITLNGKRFVEAEKILNAIDQTGPVGKLISIPIPEEFYSLLQGTEISISIDDVAGAGDGFALDFIRILINRKRENTCKGTFRGKVYDKETGEGIQGATVQLADRSSVTTDAEGYYQFTNIPTGFEVVVASAKGYRDGTGTADVGQGDENPETHIGLDRGSDAIKFGTQTFKVGESITLNNILFEVGTDKIRPESQVELKKLQEFMKDNPNVEIEISGHTSSEGDAAINNSLSYKRALAIKNHLVTTGTATERITAIGYGSLKPVAKNDSEENRKLNRRVELRVVKN